MQVEGPELRFGERVAAEPAVLGVDGGGRRRDAGRRVHRLIGVGFAGGVGVGADHAAAGEVAQRVVFERHLAFELRARGFAHLPGAPIGDGPEFVGAGPRDAPFGGTAHFGDLAPFDAVVRPHAGWDRVAVAVRDQQAAVGFPELDVADLPEADRQRQFRRAGRRLRWGGLSRLFTAPPSPPSDAADTAGDPHTYAHTKTAGRSSVQMRRRTRLTAAPRGSVQRQ